MKHESKKHTPSIASVSTDENVLDSSEEDQGEEVEIIEIGSLLPADEDDIRIALPPHRRSVAHTLNLTASHDTLEALKDSMAYKRLHNSALAKCTAIWNAAARPKAAEVVMK
jgi:hypothetical protein